MTRRALSLILCHLAFVLPAAAATFNVSGTTLAINLTAANESVAITAGASNYSFALTGGTWSGTDSADATGNGTTSLSAVKASFTVVTVDDASTGNAANFNDSGANTYSSNFTIKMDGASPGVSNFAGATPFAGNAALFVQAGSVNCNPGTVISAVDGNLTLLGNMQTPGLTGNVFGIFMNDTQIRVTGSGNLTLKGTCGISTSTVSGVRLNGASTVTGGPAGSTLTIEGYGAASSTRNYGVNLSGTSSIATLGGDVVVAGVAGTSSTGDNKGVLMEVGTSILATGSGSITMTGTGGGTAGTVNTGIEMLSGTQIASVNGNVSVTGTGGGGATGSVNRGVFVAGTIKSTGSGNVSVTGTGGPGSGGDNQGVLMERNGTGTVQEIKSGSGNVTVTGTAGGGTGSLGIKVNSVAAAAASISTGTPGGISLITDSINLVTSAVISAPSVTVAPKTPGQNIDLGSSSDTIANTLALSQAELNTITANTLNVGDLNTAVINFSANLTRPAGSTTNLIAAAINFNGFGITGGTVRQTVAGQPDISVVPSPGVFGSVAQGSTRDLVFTLSNVGFVDLTGISLAGLSSTDFSVVASPAASVSAGGSTSFTIRFAPTIPGTSLATLQIASSDPDENPAIIQFTGFSPSSSPLNGTKSVGPTGYYSSLTQATTDIQTAGLGGPLVLELQPAYLGSVETFPLVFGANLTTTVTNTLTIRPASGATGLSISSADTTAATVDLNGAQFVTFDGRPGGVGSNAGSGGGTASQLTIANTSTTGVALRFINEASGNTLRYTTLRSANALSNSGTVRFFTTTGANGNDNNTIDHCDIGDGAAAPVYGIYAFGSSATTAQRNSGNTISSCNIFNFYRSSGQSGGIYLTGGDTDWTISDNSFYQTSAQTAVNSTALAIFIDEGSGGNNFSVTGNFIGGRAPAAGGAAWTTTGTTAAYLFQGIRLNVGTTTPSSVQGNTIANIVWTSSSTAATLPGVWSGIYVSAGNVNIGTVTGNAIGSGTGSISVTTSGNGGTSFGIGAAGAGTRIIANNTIDSITVNGSATTISASLTGIQVTAGANTINNNTVGSTTTANSLNATTSSTSTTGQQVTGILSSSSTSASITGNTVANLNNSYNSTATAGQIRGIVTSAGVNTIAGNTVRNLATTSQNANSTTAQSVYGIIDTSTAAGQTVSQNTVHSLANTAASATVGVTGIYFAGPTSGTNVIARNFVHSLAVSSTSATSAVNGMQFVAGNFTAQNNLVRVGLDASGSSTAGASIVRGIFDNGTTAGRNFFHNSVFVGGTQTSGTAATVALGAITGVSNTRTYQNNIFVNSRSNSGATSKHLAVSYGGSTVNPTGLTAGGNLFLASGTGGVLGFYNSADVTTLAAWQTATGQDATSYNVDPRFINPTGTAATVDLHLQTVNPAEAKGVAGTGVTDDFDGQTRADYTATDIGADAGNFIYAASSTELNPVISFTPAADTTRAATRVLSAFASITDDGAIATGPDAPRLYFKKGSEADAFGANTSAANGWKYVTASNAGSPYDFTIDYSLLATSLSVGDVIQYFIAAQDSTGNFASSPPGAAYSSTAAPVSTVNARPASVASYTIVNTPPTFSAYALTTKKNTAATIGLAKLLARAADSDVGTPAITAVSAASSQGGSVSLTASSVTYTPANNFTGLDTFTLTIIDGQGGSVTGTVTVNVTDATAASGNQASQIVLQPGGEVSVLFFGIPGQVYQIQRSPDLTTWIFLQNATAAADGSIPITDPSPPPGAGFYRTVVP